MIDLKVVFDRAWLKAKASEGVRVVRILEKWIAAEGSVKVKSSSGDSVVVEMAESQCRAFEKALVKKLADDFNAKEPAKLVSYSETPVHGAPSIAEDDDGAEDAVEDEVSVASGEDLATDDDQEEAESVDDSKGKAVSEHAAEPAQARREKKDAEQSTRRSASVLESMLQGVPFKYSEALASYMRETNMVIPMLQKLDAMKSFWSQSLLVAMDDGYGMTDFLRALAQLYAANGLAAKDLGERAVREMKIGVGAHEELMYSDWESALKVARDMKRANENTAGSRPILCLDIGAWQGKLLHGEVKEFLRKLNANSDNFTLIFRIPFVEARSMSVVEETLSDVFSIRALVVTPTPLGNLAEYAKEQLAKRDFTLADDAVESVERMIIEEKRDDSFFGYKTVDKLVDRIIYEKAMENCRTGRTDRNICRGDAALRVDSDLPAEEDPRKELEALVGLASVKEKVAEIVSQIKTQRKLSSKGRKVRRPAIHMLFTGNPGTGKTTVARIVARLLRNEGVLRKGHLIEVKGRDLCGEYIGQTAPKTSAICRDAYGSVLFIDEAYSLFRGDGSDRDYGREALDTLIAEMENHRDDMCVIMAGYTDEMETMLGGNAGLRSRIPYTVDFPNYTKAELGDIFFSMLGSNFDYEKSLEKAVRTFFNDISDETLNAKGFSNARFVRNLYERTWGKAAYRSRLDDGEIKILASDLLGAANEKEFQNLMVKTVHRSMGFGAWSD